MQQLINTLVQSTEYHLLAAAILGLLVAVNPCQIAICISALVSVNNDGNTKSIMKNSLMFVFGRATFYLLLGTTLLVLFHAIDLNPTEVFSEEMVTLLENILPYVVLLIGLFFLVRALFKHHHNDNCHNSASVVKKHKKSGLFILGLLLAGLFCPESAVLFFVVLMPMVCLSKIGILVLLVFAVCAVVPILAMAKMAQISLHKVQKVENRLEAFQLRINLVSAILLIVMAIWLLV